MSSASKQQARTRSVTPDSEEDKAIRRKAYLWNTTGSMLSAFQSVFILVVLTRAFSLEAAGIFTLAYANASLFLNVGRFGIRNYQASDVEPRFGFRAYALSRVITCSAMVAMGMVHLAWSSHTVGYPLHKSLVIAFMILLKTVEAVIDMFSGSYQQDGRLDLAGKQQALNVAGVIVVYTSVSVVAQDLVVGTAAALICSIALLVATTLWYGRRYHIPILHREAPDQSPWPLLRECIPLFLAAFLLFYVGNAPKYAIDALLDDVAQAQYGFIAMPVFVVGLLAQFVYMPLVEPLSQMWARGDRRRFLRTFFQQVGVVAGITFVCVLGAALLGPPVLSMLYNTDLVPFRLELCVLVLGGGFLALATLFTMGVTVVRQQRLLTPGYVVVALAAWALASPLVRLWAIRGASLTYLACMVALSLWTGLIFASCVRRKRATASCS